MKTNNRQRVFKESFKKPQLKDTKDSSKEGRIAKAIATLKSIPNEDFYPALLIYERLDIENPSEELIDIVADIADEYDSVYDDSIRYAIEEATEDLPEDVLRAKVSVEVKQEEPVEERLGEFRKGSKLVKKEHSTEKDFNYK